MLKLLLTYDVLILTFFTMISYPYSSSVFSAVNSEKVSKATVIVRKPLLTVKPSSTLVEKIEIKEIRFVPGQATGVHLHPIPVVGYIAQGSILFQNEGQPPKMLSEGDAFYEPANLKIMHFDNVSKNQHAKFIAFYLLKNESQELIQLIPN